jgi:DNA-binding FrmR family transcriptional regulator
MRQMEPDHKVTVRLRRIEGQLTGIRRMYEEGRYCVDVLDQLAAARAGIEAAALLILEKQVDGCVREAFEDGDTQTRTAELVSAVRRFVRSV